MGFDTAHNLDSDLALSGLGKKARPLNIDLYMFMAVLNPDHTLLF